MIADVFVEMSTDDPQEKDRGGSDDQSGEREEERRFWNARKSLREKKRSQTGQARQADEPTDRHDVNAEGGTFPAPRKALGSVGKPGHGFLRESRRQ
jgi:hypothetical protein